MDDEICKFTVWLHSMNPSDTSGTYVNQQIEVNTLNLLMKLIFGSGGHEIQIKEFRRIITTIDN